MRAPFFLLAALLLARHAAAADTIPLTVIKHDWHSSIAIPLAAIQPPLTQAVHAKPGDDTLVIGFGARVWMGQPGRGLSDAIDALSGSPGAVQITAEQGLPYPGDPITETVVLQVSPQAITALADFAFQAIAKQPDGHVAPYAEPVPGNCYYDSSVHYGMLHNSNSWIAEALHQAGLPISPDNIVRASAVISAARELAGRR